MTTPTDDDRRDEEVIAEYDVGQDAAIVPAHADAFIRAAKRWPAERERRKRAEAERDAAFERVRELEAAGRALVERLGAMEEPLNNLCMFSAIHSNPYTGPEWSEPLDAMRALLSTPAAPREGGE